MKKVKVKNATNSYEVMVEAHFEGVGNLSGVVGRYSCIEPTTQFTDSVKSDRFYTDKKFASHFAEGQ